MRTLAMPKAAEPWSLTSLREKLIKIGAKVVSRRYAAGRDAGLSTAHSCYQVAHLTSRIGAFDGPLSEPSHRRNRF
jgi:hypothetical protein